MREIKRDLAVICYRSNEFVWDNTCRLCTFYRKKIDKCSYTDGSEG